jgi:Flp pilus assembly protein TadG
MLTRSRLLMRRFIPDRSGISAIEFAFLAPVALLLLLGGVDIVRYVTVTEKMQNVASTIGQMISQNTTGSVSYIDLTFYRDSTMVIFPQLLTDASQQGVPWSNDIGITISSVQFTSVVPSCTTNCTYIPKVIWSGGASPRSCLIPPTPVSNNAAPSSTTLPTDVFGPNSLIVVDVTYQFRPTIAPFFLKTIQTARSYYVVPRFVSQVQYQTIPGDNGIVQNCA